MSVPQEQIQRMLQNPAAATPTDAPALSPANSGDGTAPAIQTDSQPQDNAAPSFSERFSQHLDTLASAPGADPALADPTGVGRNKMLVAAATSAMQPGSFASKLAGAVQKPQQPLGVRVVNGIAARLGDAAGGMEVNGGHGGALSGVVGTLRAGAQRDAQQKQQDFENQISLAHSNAQMHKEQLLIHQLGDEATDKSIATGKTAIQTLLDAPQPGQVSHAGLDSDALHTLLINGKVNPTTQTVFTDGKVQTGVDQNGIPVYRTTYSVVSLPKEVTVNEDQAKDLSEAGQEVKAGQVLSGVQFNSLSQQASNVRASQAAKKKFLEDNEMAGTAQAKNLEASRLDQNPLWLNALAHNGGDPIKAMEAIQDNPEILKKLPYIRNDVRMWMGGTKENPGANFDEVLKLRQKKLDDAGDELTKLQKDLNEATGEKAASIAAGIQSKLDDPKTPAEAKPRLQQMLKQANAASTASLNFETRKEQSKKAVETAASTGDVDGLVDAALNYQVDPKDLFTARKDTRAMFIKKMLEKDPTWSEPEYRARYKTVQDFTPEGEGGQQVTSLNVFTGHTSEANDLIQSLRNTNSPWLNKPMNKIAVGLGNDKVQPFETALEAVKDEYLNFLKAGHAPQQAELDRAEQIVSPSSTPAQIQATLRQMARTVAIRAESLNHQYRATMHADYPDMLTPESAQVLRNFGIDISRVGGVTGGTQQPQQPPPLPQAALSQLKEGVHTKFANGQTWMLQNGKPVQVQ